MRLSGLLLGLGNSAEMTLGLLRGVVLAHLLAPEDFGIGVTLTAIAAVAESISDVGLAQMAVRTNSDVVERVLRTLHSLSVLRGLAIGACMIIAGYVLQPWLATQNTTWAFYVLGASSAVRGFTNLGLKAMQRGYAFGAEAATSFGSQLAWTLVSILGAMWTHSFAFMAWGALAYAAAYTLLSQLLSPTPWRLGWVKDDAAEAAKYGAALIPNGIALALTNVGDRLVVGAQFGHATLALYSTSSTSILFPRSFIYRYLISIFIPIIVNHAESRTRSQSIFVSWTALVALLSFSCGLGFIAVGRSLVTIVYGGRYDPGQALAIAFGLSVCVKVMALVPIPPALAHGRTHIVFLTSAGSAIALVLGAFFAWAIHGSLSTFVAATAVLEGISVITMVYLIRQYAAAVRSPLIIAASPIVILGILGLAMETVGSTLAMKAIFVAIAIAAYLATLAIGLRTGGVSLKQALSGGMS